MIIIDTLLKIRIIKYECANWRLCIVIFVFDISTQKVVRFASFCSGPHFERRGSSMLEPILMNTIPEKEDVKRSLPSISPNSMISQESHSINFKPSNSSLCR